MIKNLTIIILLAALLALAFTSFRFCKNLSVMDNLINKKENEVKRWKDRYNNIHATVEHLKISKDVAQVYYAKQIDSMAGLLKIKPRQVTSIVRVPFKVNIDSLKSTLKDTVYYQGLMNLTKYDKPSGFLGLKKKHYLDVHFNNPAFSPLDVSDFDITPPKKRWGIGPYVGYGWNGVRMAPSIGISLQYNLIRF